MDQEISKGTWVGATILAIVAILALSFAVYGIARSLVNNSSADFVKTIDSVGQSNFNDYDGTVVSGLQVRSALDSFEGDKVAILINTAGVQNAVYGSTLNNTTAKTSAEVRAKLVMKEAYATADTTNGIPDMLNVVNYGGKMYINYNVLISDFSKLSNTTEGHLEYTGDFVTRAGTSDLVFNTVRANYKTSGCSEFISNSSNFNCKLIKDASGTVVGILFTQVY